MPPKMTDNLRKVTALANQEAQSLKHDYISSGHLFLALLRLNEGTGVKALKARGLNLGKIGQEVRALMGAGLAEVCEGKLPYLPAAKKALDSAFKQAGAMNLESVSTGFLLTAILLDRETVPALVLNSHGVHAHQISLEVMKILGLPLTIQVRLPDGEAMELPLEVVNDLKRAYGPDGFHELTFHALSSVRLAERYPLKPVTTLAAP